ncbi:MAG: hypothetical protein C4521_07355 [Actinobacteria bacterium]|nr:MAG: hypothetical protein C4521_07355 [Actinomycetota bacterium]
MTSSDLVMLAGIAVTLGVSTWKSPEKTKKALRVSLKQFVAVLPFFVAVFAAIGLFEVLLTPQQITAALGEGRGMLGPVIATILGGLATGPPAAVFPLGEYLLSQEASVAAVASLLVAWVAVGTVSLPAEIRFFGPRFAMIRWTATLVLSVLLGVLMGWIL